MPENAIVTYTADVPAGRAAGRADVSSATYDVFPASTYATPATITLIATATIVAVGTSYTRSR
jgi:hypothetical protein